MSSTNEPEKKEPQTPGPESTAGESQKTAEPTLVTEVDVLHTFVEEYKTRDDQNSCLQRRNFWLGMTTAVLLFAYTTITALQWNAIIESNSINREALTSVQRAYVGLKAIQAYYVPDAQGSIAFWDFRGEWENSGTTPTRTLRQHFNYEWRDKPFPDDYDFPDKGPDKNITIFIAPRATVLTGSMAVPPDVLRRVQEGKQHLYFWGWTAYRDVFENSELHLTEFCREVITIYGDAMKGTGARVVSTYCPSRNCVDKDCKDYAEAEMKLQGK